MGLDPPIRQMLTALATMGTPSLAAETPEAARETFRLLTVTLRQPEHVVPVRSVEDRMIPGPAGEIPARIYRPDAPSPNEGPPPAEPSRCSETAEPLPTILFIHGGGFVIGDLDTHDNQCRTLCRNVGAVVVSVSYRLAPEAPFPAAPEDCAAALAWMDAHVGELGGDADRLVIGGDSAGANLAAVTARAARDGGGPPLAAQLLLYPATDFRADDSPYPSREENATGYYLTRVDMDWFSARYLATADPEDPRLSPIVAADLAGLPPAVIVTAEYDPLRDEGEAYAHALTASGVPVSLTRYDGLIHGFFGLAALSPAAADAVAETCANLKRLLT
jgi:acetyl esterase